MLNKQPRRQSQGGNVLFLILIAVALFAALSYVVTQSTRSGGGSTEREKNKLSSAQMTQYPTALRTAIIRLVLGGVGIENVKFNAPGDFGVSTNLEVFHPDGGGATYQDAPTDLSATGSSTLRWYYNANFYVPGIGIDPGGAAGNDVIAFLPGISAGVCKQTNTDLGIVIDDSCSGGAGEPKLISGTPKIGGSINLDNDIKVSLDATHDFPTTAGKELQCDGADAGTTFARQASGCFNDGNTSTPTYIFYSVLLER